MKKEKEKGILSWDADVRSWILIYTWECASTRICSWRRLPIFLAFYCRKKRICLTWHFCHREMLKKVGRVCERKKFASFLDAGKGRIERRSKQEAYFFRVFACGAESCCCFGWLFSFFLFAHFFWYFKGQKGCARKKFIGNSRKAKNCWR